MTHKLQMDNDPKPIEKVWGSMKNFLWDVHFWKPKNWNLAGLKDGIKEFWNQNLLQIYKLHTHSDANSKPK